MADGEFEKVTIRLFRGQRERLQGLFPTTGYNGVIRILVDNLIKTVEEKRNQAMSDGKPFTIDVDLDS